jgi:predicted phage terminase large subunit-like protein
MGEALSRDFLDKAGAAALKLSERKESKEYEDSLLDFAGYVWPVVEPAIPFIRGWVIEAIAAHLEAVTYGHIRRLLINVPPGFSKSLMTDVFWPAWEWGPRNMPWLRYVCASYSNHLTERDNLRCRNIVVNQRYRRLWGQRFGISNEQFTKIKFANDQTGWKLATSVGGIGVGERGDRFIIDDGNNTMEMESEVTRNTTNMWFTEVVPDRLNNQSKSAIVVIQQRLHEDDISGVALSRQMGYTHLCVPMEYVPRIYVNGFDANDDIRTYIDDDANKVEEVFWEDPRSEDGELAWVERFPRNVVEDLKRDKGPYAYVGQYQQTPEPRGGAIIKREYWQLWKDPKFPPFEYIIASLDTAYTSKQENDPSAMTIWGLFRQDPELVMPGGLSPMAQAVYNESLPPKLMLIYAWQDRLEFNALCEKVLELCIFSKEREFSFPVDRLIIEAKAAGHSLTQELYRMIGGRGKMGLDLIDPARGKWTPDKVARVHSIQHLFADKMIYAPERAYSDMVINQCAIFPKGSHDDLVDSTSMALRYLRDAGFALRREEHSIASADEMTYRSPRSSAPLYPV